MRPSFLVPLTLALATATALPAAAQRAPEDRIVRSVERLAESQAVKPATNGDIVCRWATQSVTYQGVTHTRRVRVCEKRSWWDELARKARSTTSRSLPRLR